MKAARLYGKGDLRVEETAAPGDPEPGWVRLKVEAAGICGSDLHNFRTGQWISRSPSTAGHELAGRVIALGDGVDTLSIGDRVAADSRFWCGTCDRCRAGRRHLCRSLGFVGEVCDGGFAEECLLPARLLQVVAPAVDARIAAMAEPLAVAMHAVRRLSKTGLSKTGLSKTGLSKTGLSKTGLPETGGFVLVAGCGPIGGLVALLLSRTFDGTVLVADRNEARRARVARVTGASPVALDEASLAAATGGAPVFAAVEATGSTAVLDALLDIVEPGGTVALVGIFHGRLDLDPNILVEREIALVGCHAFADELPEAVAMLGELGGPLAELVDREIGLDEVPAAYERLLAGQAEGLKTIIRMPPPAGA